MGGTVGGLLGDVSLYLYIFCCDNRDAHDVKAKAPPSVLDVAISDNSSFAMNVLKAV
jgi:hypothetical protein